MHNRYIATQQQGSKMTLLVNYESKKAMKECVGKRLDYIETSTFGPEYKSNGKFAVAGRPRLCRKVKKEFFAQVTMEDDLIVKVE